MSRVTVARVESEADYEPFRALLRRYQEGLPEDLRVRNLELELKTLQEKYPRPDCALFVAHDGGAPAGCVLVKPFDPLSLELRRLYVEPAARGIGAARALMEVAVAFARERSYARIVLDTERDRLRPAYELYLNLGFVECAEYAPAEYPNATFMELVLV
jgi:GNAT superfamily N-acetyltransferase